jgi:hypothetical protein
MPNSDGKLEADSQRMKESFGVYACLQTSCSAASGNIMHRRQVISIRAGTLDDPEVGKPGKTIWTSSAPSWGVFDPDIPRERAAAPAHVDAHIGSVVRKPFTKLPFKRNLTPNPPFLGPHVEPEVRYGSLDFTLASRGTDSHHHHSRPALALGCDHEHCFQS